VRRSDDIIELWEAFIHDSNPNDLGDERWMILEQVVVAAYDTHRPDVVEDCLKELATMFDGMSSFRMRRLQAMKAEMVEEYDVAIDILDSILEEDDANSAARKRKVAILKAQGENAKAISELNRYLKDFMADGEAWMELSDLYILEQDYAKAAFCCEELILQNPHNHLYYQRY
jgi:tetratricopeptide (TPR) repeat protein